MSDSPDQVLVILARLEASQTRLEQGQHDIVARIDRVQDTVTTMQAGTATNFGAVRHIDRRNENTRDELRLLANVVHAMQRPIQHLQVELRDLRGARSQSHDFGRSDLSPGPIGVIMSGYPRATRARLTESAR